MKKRERERLTKISGGLRTGADVSQETVTPFTRKFPALSIFVGRRTLRLQEEQRSKFYRNLDEMPLARFIDVLCDSRYDSLYAENPPKWRDKQLEKEHFDEFYEEYATRILDGDSSVYENLKRMALLLARVRILDAAMLLAAGGAMSDDTRRIVKSFGIHLTGRPAKDAAIIFSLRELTIRKYDHARRLYESEEKDDTKQDRMFFIRLLVCMSSHFKYNIPYYSITTGEFCAYYLQMKNDIRAMKNEQQRHRQYGRKHR